MSATISWSAQNSEVLTISYSGFVSGNKYSFYFSIGNNTLDFQEFMGTSSNGTVQTNAFKDLVRLDKNLFNVQGSYDTGTSITIQSYIVPGWGFAQSPDYSGPSLTITPIVDGTHSTREKKSNR